MKNKIIIIIKIINNININDYIIFVYINSNNNKYINNKK